jgi:membrane protease YdiL (CAAX protease family)
VCFGFAHTHQGVTGIISTGISACIFGISFLASGKRLWLPIIAHGVDDTIGFVAIFLGLALV